MTISPGPIPPRSTPLSGLSPSSPHPYTSAPPRLQAHLPLPLLLLLDNSLIAPPGRIIKNTQRMRKPFDFFLPHPPERIFADPIDLSFELSD